MKNKFMILTIIILLTTGCLPNTEMKSTKTKNNSIMFYTEKDINAFCSKTTLDSIMARQQNQTIKQEFSLEDYDKNLYINDKKSYNVYNNPDKKCQYKISYKDIVNKANYTNVTNLSLDKDEEIDVTKLISNKKLKDFMDKKQTTVIDTAVYNYMLKNNKNSMHNTILKAKDSGEYTLKATLIFRMYHFSDLKLIYDYDLSGLRGITFELVKNN